MSYEAFWVDDEWLEGRTGSEAARLEEDSRVVSNALEEAGVDVHLSKSGSAGKALGWINDPLRDFRLAILDYKYPSEDASFTDLVRALEERHIPFFVFSGWVKDAELDRSLLRAGPLCLGIFEKMKGVAGVAKAVVNFFRAPPIRLLHVTDLHFNSELENDGAHEQHQLFSSLERCLNELSDKRPFDGLVISGDIACFDPAQDLVAARVVVRNLISASLGPTSLGNVFIVPGNHDVAWKDFESRRLAPNPWAPFTDFYQWVYAGHSEILEEMAAWEREEGVINPNPTSPDLNWARRLGDPPLSVVGIVSPVLDPDQQGAGNFETETEELVAEAWDPTPVLGEIRIAVVHHNLFSVSSLSRDDEQSTFRDSGGALRVLLDANCSVVLSGHTHTPECISYRSRMVIGDRYEDLGALTVSSAGTTGGFHKGKQRPRSFSVLEFSSADPLTGSRTLDVLAFLFRPEARRWVEAESEFRVIL